MKYYKITLPKDPVTNELLYPEGYQVEVGNKAIDHLYYDIKGDTFLILLIEDKKAENIIRDGVEEITEADMQAVSTINETQKTVIKDEGELRRLELKTAAGLPLTVDEVKKIDLDDPSSLFGKTKTLSERAIEYGSIKIKT